MGLRKIEELRFAICEMNKPHITNVLHKFYFILWMQSITKVMNNNKSVFQICNSQEMKFLCEFYVFWVVCLAELRSLIFVLKTLLIAWVFKNLFFMQNLYKHSPKNFMRQFWIFNSFQSSHDFVSSSTN